MVEERERRTGYAQAVLAAGDRYRKTMEAATKEVRDAYDVANQRFRERMHQTLRVYDEELKAAAVEYEREDK